LGYWAQKSREEKLASNFQLLTREQQLEYVELLQGKQMTAAEKAANLGVRTTGTAQVRAGYIVQAGADRAY